MMTCSQGRWLSRLAHIPMELLDGLEPSNLNRTENALSRTELQQPGAAGRSRTDNLGFTKALHCQLCYHSMEPTGRVELPTFALQERRAALAPHRPGRAGETRTPFTWVKARRLAFGLQLQTCRYGDLNPGFQGENLAACP